MLLSRRKKLSRIQKGFKVLIRFHEKEKYLCRMRIKTKIIGKVEVDCEAFFK